MSNGMEECEELFHLVCAIRVDGDCACDLKGNEHIRKVTRGIFRLPLFHSDCTV